MSSVRYWVWLSSVTFANPRAKYALVERWGDAESAFLAPPGAYRDLPGVSANEAELFERRDLREADRILEACRREDIRILTLADAAYPRRLPSVAVIGTRRATPYGLKMGRDIAFEIASCGGIVVSGLTEGIDRAAARGCLLAGGCCIGVLGTGHGAGGELREDVAATGALVSEYPPGTKAEKRFFRDRNRISAGLSHAVCVVEAPERSGSLLFAQEALVQARPAACGWDVLEDFAALYPDRLRGPGAQRRAPTMPGTMEKPVPRPEKPPARPAETDEKRAASAKKEIDKEKSAGYIDLHEQLRDLSEDQLQIVTAIGRGETHIDDIIEATGMSAAKVLSQLTVLEIKGCVRRVAGRRVCLNTIQK